MEKSIKKATRTSIAALILLAALLQGCVVSGNGQSYFFDGAFRRVDDRGDQATWDSDRGWIRLDIPEAEIQRMPVWYITAQESGIKAWRYGFRSDENYRYIDPYAPMVEFSEFSGTRWVTYTVKGENARDYIVKRANFRTNGAPEVLGILEGQRGEWRFTPPDGQSYAGYGYVLTSKGIMLERSGSVFAYLPSDNPKAHLLPEGWSFAWVQKGDIEATRLMTVIRPLNVSLFNIRASNFEFGFYDIDRGAIVETFGMKLTPRYEAENSANMFYLFDTAEVPMSIAIEDGYQNVTVRNIRSGKERVAFHRDLGISRLECA